VHARTIRKECGLSILLGEGFFFQLFGFVELNTLLVHPIPYNFPGIAFHVVAGSHHVLSPHVRRLVLPRSQRI
jgi:hypothetical protein